MQHPTIPLKYPRTPYPLEVIQESSLEASGSSMSQWLDLKDEDEYYPEYLALSPSQAGHTTSGEQWVAGVPDEIEECASSATEYRIEEVATESIENSDISMSPESSDSDDSDLLDIELLERAIAAEIAETTSQSDGRLAVPTADFECLSPPPQKRRHRSESLTAATEALVSKRPRLEPLMTGQCEIAVPAAETQPPVGGGPTPISPNHQFVQVLAERQTRCGRLFKVCWRESWVHEDKMPDLSPVRRSQLERFGVTWDVLPASPGIPELV